ncbi:hypothetical protein [Chelativorans intermedius]|uniref:Cell division and transport-associated protein TolA n=1 Tax=Chelativorans intermedius TaxID=515947 RepID=A0ABV6DBT7_9HYPH|nr:hypothetical protein [Chelativorans intermedius]MCT8997939.1 hypothetical protein [Chelativorans intermedius]
MKTGLAISVTMHAALLGFGIFSLSTPRAFEVADVEALPVDIVPVESITQVQEGDRQAPAERRPAPRPTLRTDEVENAQKVGEAETDLKSPPTPDAKPKPVERAAEPPPAPAPRPQPVETAAEEAQVAEAEPVPATERQPEPQPRQEVTPDPTDKPMVAENAEAESVTLPRTAPVPQARPQPPRAQTAKAPERRQAEAETPAPRQQARGEKKDDELFDQVAALLNKERASGGGARRSTGEAALGGTRTTAGEQLTQSEMDALRGQIQRCWNVPAGAIDAANLKVSLRFRLDPSGAVEGNPEIISGGDGSGVARAAAESARRAILQCAPYNLPTEKYSAWADVIVHFDPSDMF